jgi:putative addiction module component (TIGR02574 family)
MSQEFNQILKSVLELAPEEQFALMQAILKTFEKNISESSEGFPYSKEQVTEIERRVAAFEAGKMKTIPGKEAFDRLRRKLA